MYRIHNTYPTGENIVKGIKHNNAGFFDNTKAEDFKLYLANILDPTNEKELNIKVIDDSPYFWTEPFKIYLTGEYILHWKNNNAGIDIKQVFTVSDRISQAKIQVKGGKLKG
jgi:hypothetical protein